MLKNDCIFCRIIKGEIPAKVIAQNDYVIAIEDIAPKAPIHYLIIPKTHLENLQHLKDEHDKYIIESARMARDISVKLGGKGFNLIANNGKDAGQIVFHLHWHFISGRDLAKIVHGL